MWLNGPDLDIISNSNDKFELDQTEHDNEVRQSVTTCKTIVVDKSIDTKRFTKFSA